MSLKSTEKIRTMSLSQNYLVLTKKKCIEWLINLASQFSIEVSGSYVAFKDNKIVGFIKVIVVVVVAAAFVVVVITAISRKK